MGLLDHITGKSQNDQGGGSSGGSSGGASPVQSSSSNDKPPEGSDPNDTEVLDEEPRNILLSLISQLRIGMDLHRVTLPTFVLEPRSMLERITDFMTHPDLIFNASKKEDPVERFVDVLRYYLSGWHIKPKGVKKPYNPILGEQFRCRYLYENGTEGFYIAEQVSHHPPISAYYYVSPQNQLLIQGELRPKSKFLGNSAATLMDGQSRLYFTDRPGEMYEVTMPNMYARGILFGKMVLELGDVSSVRCAKTGLHCDLEFKTKGFFSGSYNAISGKVKDKDGNTLYDISGHWNETMYIKGHKSKKEEVLFSVEGSKIFPKVVNAESDQEANESRRLWAKVTQAIKNKDLDAATDSKTAIEDRQRADAKKRDENNEEWDPKWFKLSKDNSYEPLIDLPLPDDVEAATKKVREWIYPGGLIPEKKS